MIFGPTVSFPWAGSSRQPAEICVFLSVNARGQTLLANTFGVSCLVDSKWNLLSQAPICRRYPSIRKGNGESGETTDAKTIWQSTDPGSAKFHFVAQTEARHPGG